MDMFVSVLGLLGEPWVLLVLLASVMFAAGNYIDELLLVDFEQPIGVLVIISGLFGFVLMAIFAVLGFAFNASLWLAPSVALQAIGVGVLEMIWVIPYLYATRRRGALIAGPLFQAVPVIALLLEATTGVIPPLLQGIGALTIVAGGILLSLEKEEAADGSSNRRIDWVTVGLMTLSASLVALIYILFKDAVGETGAYVAVGFWSALGIGLTGVVIYLVWTPYRRDFTAFTKAANGKAVCIQLLNELMDQGGAYLVHLGNVLGGQVGVAVGVVTAFNATQPIAIGLIGALLVFVGLRQRNNESRGVLGWLLIAVAIGLIAAGTIMVALG